MILDNPPLNFISDSDDNSPDAEEAEIYSQSE
jgi:hypothetical protein